MAEEIELKLSIDPADHRRFMAHPILRQASRRTDQVLDNIYYDTPEHALRTHGIALRLRKQGRQRLQTIKLAPKIHHDNGLSVRPEWETPFRRQFDFSVVEVAAVRDWLQAPAIAGRLVPLFQTRFRRITWHVPLWSGGEVLVALDRGLVSAGAQAPRHEEISEIELELAGSHDVASLRRLAGELGHRVTLTPFDLSKARRGYTLLALAEGKPHHESE